MRIAVVGTGYVGLTTGVCLASLGHEVRAVDLLAERVTTIGAGKAPFYEPGLPEMLAAAISAGRLRAATQLADAVAASEVTFITVGTPQAEQGIDLSQVAEAARQIGAALRTVTDYRVVVVKSTVVPGTTDTLVRGVLEECSGKSAGEFGLCMNPEFLREGSAIEDFLNPDRIVVGQWDEKSGRVLAELYGTFDCPKIFTALRNAEMMKYASNALLATLISYSNEIATVCEATPGTDAETVLRGVHLDRRLSPVINGQRVSPGILSFLLAGCGFGGSCLPKDVNALRAHARGRRVVPRLLDAVMDVNARRGEQFGKMAEAALGSLQGATLAVLGLAFKPGTDDVRESPALAIIKHLVAEGASVRVYDSIVKAGNGNGLHIDATFCATPAETVAGADGTLIVTACPEFAQLDWAALCGRMRRQIIVDGRNALKDVSWPETARYIPIGRTMGKGEDSKSVARWSESD